MGQPLGMFVGEPGAVRRRVIVCRSYEPASEASNVSWTFAVALNGTPNPLPERARFLREARPDGSLTASVLTQLGLAGEVRSGALGPRFCRRV